MSISHPYFGEIFINPDNHSIDVCWEETVRIHKESDTKTEVWLWACSNHDLTTTLLDKFAFFCTHLAKFDEQSRQALINYLREDDTYITEHLKAFNEASNDAKVSPPLFAIYSNPPITPEKFVAQMQLTSIGLWASPNHIEVQDIEAQDTSNTPIIMDYMIDSEFSDQILAIKLSIEGEVMHIDWES